jgi:pimeloyl-ACP methyl ester carboxylesterase
MDADQDMAQTSAHYMPDAQHIARCKWLTEEELSVYTQSYHRTGFQGGLHWYRCGTEASCQPALNLFSGRTIGVPSGFISGQSDWGTYQSPGAFEKMQNQTCTQMTMCELVPNAGHWVQQEQAEAVSTLLIKFLSGL